MAAPEVRSFGAVLESTERSERGPHVHIAPRDDATPLSPQRPSVAEIYGATAVCIPRRSGQQKQAIMAALIADRLRQRSPYSNIKINARPPSSPRPDDNAQERALKAQLRMPAE